MRNRCFLLTPAALQGDYEARARTSKATYISQCKWLLLWSQLKEKKGEFKKRKFYDLKSHESQHQS